jgi:hypothetical protein
LRQLVAGIQNNRTPDGAHSVQADLMYGGQPIVSCVVPPSGAIVQTRRYSGRLCTLAFSLSIRPATSGEFVEALVVVYAPTGTAMEAAADRLLVATASAQTAPSIANMLVAAASHISANRR